MLRLIISTAVFIFWTSITGGAQKTAYLTIPGSKEKVSFSPLEDIVVASSEKGKITVLDGSGVPYLQSDINEKLSFSVGGALGNQTVLLQNPKGELLDWISFKVNGQTFIQDETGKYQALLQSLYHSMVGEWGSEAHIVRYDGEFYHFFVRWLRDHVHTLKGMKYFYPELQSGIDLYAKTQREDGMIWDNVYPRNQEKNWWDKRFRYGDFIREAEDGLLEFKRIPIENDVEYLFIEGLYYTWKATGDDTWMQAHLDKALKAIAYATTDRYRWSEKHQLLKRGFTIDTWDFQSDEDAALVGGDIMVVELNKSRFGIMFGDNTGMAASCTYLAEMLHYAGRNREASQIDELGRQLQNRIDQLAWNGSFYTHHIPEDPNLRRELGVDLNQQVSLSNAYSLNRNLSHQQCVAIINTYQEIRKKMPASSPGEWFTIFPPFEFGFGKNDSSSKWEYMNGGVTSIVAGELARGAFEHGYENYAIDILNRLADLARETDNFLECVYRGNMPKEPKRQFTVVDLKGTANANYPGDGATFNGATITEESINGQKYFNGIPFLMLDQQDAGSNCLQLSKAEPEKVVPVNAKAQSVYLLHTASPGPYAGHIEIQFTDGTSHVDYITMDKIGNWWIENEKRNKNIVCKKAWRSNNDQYVAFYTYGLNNPFPKKEIKNIKCVGTKDGRQWNIKGITISDYPVFYMPDMVSHGIPDNWGAAAVVSALMEGLVGIKNEGVGFDQALIAPRWVVSSNKSANVMVHYPASNGYVSYQYQFDPNKKIIRLKVTGNGDEQSFQVLLPPHQTLDKIRKNDLHHSFTTLKIEQSTYAVFQDQGVGVKEFDIYLKSE